jgi:ribosome-associated protein
VKKPTPKPTSRKAAPKKAAAKKAAPTKAKAPTKAPAKTKKAAVKKPVVKKVAPAKKPVKKVAARKVAPKTAIKKAPVKKTPVKKAPVKKAPVKKASAKKSDAKKVAAPKKKVAARKAPARKPRAQKPVVLSPSQQALAMITQSLDADQADNIAVIDLAGKSAMADYMVVASGRNPRHIGAMAQHLREKIKAMGGNSPAVEGLANADWVLVDQGDVIIHLFRPEVRELYNLEKMWGAAMGPEDDNADPRHP